MKFPAAVLTLVLTLAFSVAGCDLFSNSSSTPDPLTGSYEFSAPVYDIAATPDGRILVAETIPPEVELPPEGETSLSTVRQISREGVEAIAELSTVQGAPINGLEAIDDRCFFATSGALDQAVGGGLWRVSQGEAQMVADIEAFETEVDPDAFGGTQWKDPQCEASETRTAGPQSNPYHLTALSGREALVADGAGNALLSATDGGTVDWVAVLTPPVDQNGDWRVLFPLDDNTNCYVQPVPTAVAVGPDGAYYVGELTGVTPAILGGEAASPLARVWRIAPGARNVVCPSDQCQEVLSGLISVIDVDFGPDGELYVVEFDANGWFAATAGGVAAGGTIKRCDVDTGDCTLIEDADVTLGAITFDRWGQMWVLENTTPEMATVRRVELP
jgi:hypothetical protein